MGQSVGSVGVPTSLGLSLDRSCKEYVLQMENKCVCLSEYKPIMNKILNSGDFLVSEPLELPPTAMCMYIYRHTHFAPKAIKHTADRCEMDKLGSSQFLRAIYLSLHALFTDGFYLGLQILIKR